jgi:hypothetical protein
MEDTNNPSAPGTDATTTFTPNETKLICAIMQNLTSEIQVLQPLKTFPPIATNRPPSKSKKHSKLTQNPLSSSTSTKSPST